VTRTRAPRRASHRTWGDRYSAAAAAARASASGSGGGRFRTTADDSLAALASRLRVGLCHWQCSSSVVVVVVVVVVVGSCGTLGGNVVRSVLFHARFTFMMCVSSRPHESRLHLLAGCCQAANSYRSYLHAQMDYSNRPRLAGNVFRTVLFHRTCCTWWYGQSDDLLVKIMFAGIARGTYPVRTIGFFVPVFAYAAACSLSRTLNRSRMLPVRV
jgi:hypothetical protein